MGLEENSPTPVSWSGRPFVERAVSTSALEGTHSALPEVRETEIAASRREVGRDVREVLNYVEATEYALNVLETRPVSRNLLLEAHQRLLSDIPPDAGQAGRIRTTQVAIGPARDQRIVASYFVPPPPGDDVDRLLQDWESWNYREDDIPLIARIAVSHYQFETIHPFTNGNGRIGRLVVALLFIDLGALSSHLLDISPYLEADRTTYGERLRAVSEMGDFDDWIAYFARAVQARSEAALERIKALRDEGARIVESVRATGMKGIAVQIAENLIGAPVISPSGVAEDLQVSYRAANRAVSRLADEGILEEVTGRSYGRIFVSRVIIEILQS